MIGTARVMGLTDREYRARKRRELRAVLKAMNELQTGIAGSSGYKEFCEAQKLLKTMQEKQSVKSWGR